MSTDDAHKTGTLLVYFHVSLAENIGMTKRTALLEVFFALANITSGLALGKSLVSQADTKPKNEAYNQGSRE